MIISTIKGGLGNQMFIYAIVRAMSLRNNTSMSFNLNYGFESDREYNRKLELQYLNTQLYSTNRLATFNYPCSKYIRSISYKVRRNIFLPQYKIFVEKIPLSFQSEIFRDRSKNIYLDGYWQSEKYFVDYAEQIRRDFTIKDGVISGNVFNERDSLNSDTDNLVFIGIRRYQDCKVVNESWVLDEDYYNKAISIMESKLTSPKFVVFSQQPEWAKNHLKAKSPIVYAKPKETPMGSIEDLYLMNHCRHAILSISSFYWWGAWLSNFGDGIVICPKTYLNKDLSLDRWIKM